MIEMEAPRWPPNPPTFVAPRRSRGAPRVPASSLLQMALLVLLPGAAVAGIVAADLLARRRARARPGRHGDCGRGAGRPGAARHLAARLLGVRPRGHGRQ